MCFVEFEEIRYVKLGQQIVPVTINIQNIDTICPNVLDETKTDIGFITGTGSYIIVNLPYQEVIEKINNKISEKQIKNKRATN